MVLSNLSFFISLLTFLYLIIHLCKELIPKMQQRIRDINRYRNNRDIAFARSNREKPIVAIAIFETRIGKLTIY